MHGLRVYYSRSVLISGSFPEGCRSERRRKFVLRIRGRQGLDLCGLWFVAGFRNWVSDEGKNLVHFARYPTLALGISKFHLNSKVKRSEDRPNSTELSYGQILIS